MPQELYSGQYVRFHAASETGSADFIGADNLVGDRYEIDIRDEHDHYRAYLVNRFGSVLGYLDEGKVRAVQLAQAKGWRSVAYLSYIAFTEGRDEDHPGYYWGEMAVLTYDHKLDDVMEPFCERLSQAMADGGRPQVDFSSKSVQSLIEGKGSWFPSDKARMPKMEKGSTIVKDHRTPNERLIEQSRKGNKGCYVISYAFIAAIVLLVVYLVYSCTLQ